MSRLLTLALVVAAVSGAIVCRATAEDTQAPATLPKPSVYPKSWELKFDYTKPTRIVVEIPGKQTPQAYWYLPYTVTNDTNQERMFLPVLEMVASDGRIIRSDKNTPPQVIEAIRTQQGNKFIQGSVQASGEIRLGESEAKYSVAVWSEPVLEMGSFAILVGGLNGETQTVKNAAGESVVLRKTLQLNYIVNGDDVYPGEDKVNDNPVLWIMR